MDHNVELQCIMSIMNPVGHVPESTKITASSVKVRGGIAAAYIEFSTHVMEGSGDAMKRGTTVAAGKAGPRPRRASPANEKERR